MDEPNKRVEWELSSYCCETLAMTFTPHHSPPERTHTCRMAKNSPQLLASNEVISTFDPKLGFNHSKLTKPPFNFSFFIE
eukprot:1971025-Amphidinium_carterae.1